MSERAQFGMIVSIYLMTAFVTFRFLASEIGGLWATVALTVASAGYTILKKDIWTEWGWLS